MVMPPPLAAKPPGEGTAWERMIADNVRKRQEFQARKAAALEEKREQEARMRRETRVQ